MTKIQIRKVNGVPMGRPVNPYNNEPETDANGRPFDMRVYPNEWAQFEQSVTEHEAPGCEEGEAEGELIWQLRANRDLVEAGIEKEIRWIDTNEAFVEELRLSRPEAFRQIWVVPTPEKVEVKEVIRKVQIVPLTDSRLAEITYPPNITIQDIKIIQKAIEMIELASPPTH